ncbi:hypothetical protein F5B20DRAFT_533819 [Whalleya microplaca]|nr:hypothetical protein F5B20DRAFT_533819 [Whalleya microplaca]
MSQWRPLPLLTPNLRTLLLLVGTRLNRAVLTNRTDPHPLTNPWALATLCSPTIDDERRPRQEKSPCGNLVGS